MIHMAYSSILNWIINRDDWVNTVVNGELQPGNIVLMSSGRLRMVCVILGADFQPICSCAPPPSPPAQQSEWKMPKAGGLWVLLSSRVSHHMEQKEPRDPVEKGLL